jgi:peptidyl-prolyl cis-trans isomerase SurA
MKLKFLLNIVLIFLFIENSSLAKIKTNIIVKVENEIITDFEIKNKILSTLIVSNQEINQNNINILKQQILNTLIKYKLKKIELSKYNIQNDKAQIQNYLTNISSGNIENFKNKFKNNNLDYQMFIEEIKTEFRWQKLVYQLYSNKIDIDDNSIEEELSNITKNKIDIIELNLSELEIFNDKNKENLKKNISTVLNSIKKEGFEAASLRYNISLTAKTNGNIGWINTKSLSKKIYNSLKNLKVGEISNPIISTGSVTFFKINDKRIIPSENINLSKIKNDLINKRKNDLYELYSKSHLSKLKNTILIEYK